MPQDLRLALRTLLKQPGFAAIAILTLALGIGATSAVFSLIQGVLLTPPPYAAPDRLVLVRAARASGEKTGPQEWPAAQWMEWQKEAKSFDAVAAYNWSFNFLILPEGSESLEGMVVTPEYFTAVGLQPLLGRAFTESEGGAKPVPVIVLGYELWQRRFNGDRDIIGKTIRMSRMDPPPAVIGVMPPGVRFFRHRERRKNRITA